MIEHEFTLILCSDPSEEDADRLYGTFNDGTVSTNVGVGQISFHRQAGSITDAIRTAIRDVRAAGLDVERILITPDAVMEGAPTSHAH